MRDAGGIERKLTLEVLQQVGYSVSFVVEQEWLVVGIPRRATSAATADVTHDVVV